MAKRVSNPVPPSGALDDAWRNQSSKPAGTSTGTHSSKAGPPELLNDVEAAELLGMPVRKFHKLRHSEWIPQAVELSPRALRWVRSELLEAVMTRAPRCKVKGEPTQLAAVRDRREASQ